MARGSNRHGVGSAMNIHVVTPWYPDEYSAYSGVFVKQQVSALVDVGHNVTLEHLEIFPAPDGAIPDEVWSAMSDLALRDWTAVYPTREFVTKVPTPVPSRSGPLGRATAYQQSLALKRKILPVEADITHAHLGVPTGLALLDLVDTPLVVTEHQSTLGRIFGQPGGVGAYRQVVESADAFLCVSDHLKNQVIEAIGKEFNTKVQVVPNVVDIGDIEFRHHAGNSIDRWIYVGTLAEHKGVRLLLEAFRIEHARNHRARLALVGEGPFLSWVERFVSANGLNYAVENVGAVPHSELDRLLGGADVMVNMSPSETFGIASLEAIGAGLPVVSLRNGGAESTWGDIQPQVGRLLNVGASPTEVADAVEQIREDRGLDLVFGRDQVLKRFSPETIAAALLEVYEAVKR